MAPPPDEDSPPPAPGSAPGSPSAAGASSLSGNGSVEVNVGNPMEERKEIKALHDFNVQAGGKYYLVDAQWWNQWREWCGFDEPGGLDEPVVSRGPRPGPIDNSNLFLAGSSAKLKAGLTDGVDYELLVSQEWALFVKWYSEKEGGDDDDTATTTTETAEPPAGSNDSSSSTAAPPPPAPARDDNRQERKVCGPVIVRRGIRQSAYGATSKTAVVEIYGLVVKVALSTALEGLAIGAKPEFFEMVVSKASTVRELKEAIMEKFGFEAGKDCRLWDWFQNKPYALLDVPSKTLQDAQVIENNDLLLELPDASGAFKIVKAATTTTSMYGGGGGGGGGNTTENVVTSAEPPLAHGVCGLQNLGNTCFMNSTLQCLSNCPPLRDYFATGAFVGDLNRGNPLGQEGKLAESFGDLMGLMWPGLKAEAANPASSSASLDDANAPPSGDGSGGGGGGGDSNGSVAVLTASSVAPRGFKYHMGRFRPEFQGYQQHDSSELMNFLLDGLHEDLNRVLQKPYTEAVEYDTKKTDEEMADLFLDTYKKRNDSFVHDLFRGQFKSTLVCPNCANVSITFDPYTMVSLPLTTAAEERQQSFKVVVWTTSGLTSFAKDTPPPPTPPKEEGEQEKEAAATAGGGGDAATTAEEGAAATAAGEEEGEEGVESWREMVNEDSSAWVGGPTTGTGGRTKTVVTVGVNKGSKAGALRLAVAQAVGVPPGRIALFQSTRSYVFKCMDDNSSLDFVSKYYNLCAHEVADEYPFSYTPPLRYNSYWGGGNTSQQQAAVRPVSPLSAVTLYFGQKRAPVSTYYANPRPVWHLFGEPWLLNVSKDPCTPKQLYEAVAASLDISDAHAKQEALKKEQQEKAKASAASSSSDEKKGDGDDDNDAPVQSLFSLYVCNDAYGSNVDLNAVDQGEEPLNGGLKAIITIVVEFHDCAAEALRGAKLAGVPGVAAKAEAAEAKSGAEGGGAAAAADDEDDDDEEEDASNSGLKLMDCFELFSTPEKLSPEDSWYCGKCKNHVEATKTMELWSAPDVLVLHLKRFSYNRYSRDKLETDVSFPLNGLDISQYVKGPQGTQEGGAVFDCVAVSNHMGSLGGGHYTASARSPVDGKWYKFNDSSTSEMSPKAVNSGDVYLLFYVRRGKFGISGDPAPADEPKKSVMV